MTTTQEPTVTERTAGQRFWRGIVEVVVVLVVATLLSVLVRTFVAQAFFVPSGSMEPTLDIGDRIIASRITGPGVQRGDIVVFTDPGGWLPPATPEGGLRGLVQGALEWVGLAPSQDHLVKRVIGLGGDHVVCCTDQGQISVNGVALDEPYIASGRTDQVRFDVTVPADSMFVMGDNRGHSEDSRFHLDENAGAVPLDDVVGPVLFTWWPVGRAQRFAPPPTFARIPAPTAGTASTPAVKGEQG